LAEGIHASAATSNVLAEGPTLTTIDFPGAISTQTWGINPHGDIVGLYVSAGVTHGFLLSGGAFTTIDFPGATTTLANGINARGAIVGGYRSAGVVHAFLLKSGNPRAVLWKKGVPLDLNTLIPPNSPLYLLTAFGINDVGEIAGFGVTSTGDIHGFLAIPRHGEDDSESADLTP
jgi:uncharacterized membrane protein